MGKNLKKASLALMLATGMVMAIPTVKANEIELPAQSDTVEVLPGSKENLLLEGKIKGLNYNENVIEIEDTYDGDGALETRDYKVLYNKETKKFEITFNIDENAEGDQVIELSKVYEVISAYGKAEIDAFVNSDPEYIDYLISRGYDSLSWTGDRYSNTSFSYDFETKETTYVVEPGDTLMFDVSITSASKHTYTYKNGSFILVPIEFKHTVEEDEQPNITGYNPDIHYGETFKNLLILNGLTPESDTTSSSVKVSISDIQKVSNYLKENYSNGNSELSFTDLYTLYLLDYYNSDATSLEELFKTNKEALTKEMATIGYLMDPENPGHNLLDENGKSQRIAQTITTTINNNVVALNLPIVIGEDTYNYSTTTSTAFKTIKSVISALTGKDYNSVSTMTNLKNALTNDGYSEIVNCITGTSTSYYASTWIKLYKYITNGNVLEILLENYGLKGSVKVDEGTNLTSTGTAYTFKYYLSTDNSWLENNFFNNSYNAWFEKTDDASFDELQNDSWNYYKGDIAVNNYVEGMENKDGAWKHANDLFQELLNSGITTSTDTWTKFQMGYNVDGVLTGNEYQDTAWAIYNSIVLRQMDFNLVLNKVDEEGNIISSSEASFYLWYDEDGNKETIDDIYYLVFKDGKYTFIKYVGGSAMDYTVSTDKGILNVENILLENRAYYIQEANAPEGYDIDFTIYVISSEEINEEKITNIANNSIAEVKKLTEEIENGTLEITIKNNKLTDDNTNGEGDVEEPTFEVTVTEPTVNTGIETSASIILLFVALSSLVLIKKIVK